MRAVGAGMVMALGAVLVAAGVPEQAGPIAGLDLSALDLATPPGDDFWRYANGGWAQRTPVPPGSDAVGVSVDARRNVDAQVHAMLDALAVHPEREGKVGGVVGALHASWLAEQQVDARGLAPAHMVLRRIARLASIDRVEAAMVMPGLPGPIAIGVAPDPAQPARALLSIEQGALGLPRDFYLRREPVYAGYRAAYLAYLRQLLTLSGGRAADARRILTLETRIAENQLDGAARRTAPMLRLSPAKLRRTVPGWPWGPVLCASGYPGHGPILVQGDGSLAALGRVLHATPLPVARAYLALRYLDGHVRYLPRRFRAARDRLDSALGVLRPAAPRAAQGVAIANELLGEAVGYLYVRRNLSAESARQVHAIFEDVRAGLRERITHAAWMDDATRSGALAKVDSIRLRLEEAGAVPPDLSRLRLDRRDLFGNVERIETYRALLDRRRLAAPERAGAREWPMSPQILNGYYYAPTNSLIINVALLQPPFFDAAADPAVNYGAIGAFIGHELGHAFDDQGSRIDAEGRERDWWTATARRAYAARTTALSVQIAAFEALPGLKVDPRLTLGENIADLIGAQAALDAYARYQKRTGLTPLVARYSGEQRLLLSLAQMRRSKLAPDAARQLAAIDGHAPVQVRINAVVRNLDAWYAAFGVQAGAKLYLPPAERVRFW
ncbi:endothelin-converting enzyme [Sphingomonas sp. NFR04]|uniref:M13-type metalloendopeptidase n=1 Tax=Sphingomonas sp. NFR04 TaxID=1566283 RepID=UPI0008F309F3|nr:M13 family metallopeptidase [Sphingomonas sp. NFR04]SFJ66266.1 endothelin-converting enzyme [Sphingomonas sp. NFR04]